MTSESGQLTKTFALKMLAKRLWAKVDVKEPDECWLWLASKSRGYGRISCAYSTLRAHRVVWELTYGPIPEGMCVLHRCDSKACCNPKHLFLGTRLDNARDMVRKGRQAIGERNGASKLTVREVLRLRRHYTGGGVTQRELAVSFGIAQPVVGCIIRRETWKHV